MNTHVPGLIDVVLEWLKSIHAMTSSYVWLWVGWTNSKQMNFYQTQRNSAKHTKFMALYRFGAHFAI